ncbi:MAG: FAD-dependent oxidoreductase [Actinomycetota bacterium]|nr:FAD-dependent oxidoreductase [Actinomycetota bacterium]
MQDSGPRRAGAEDLATSLVAPTPALVMRPRLYEAEPESLAVDLRPLLDTLGAQFVEGTADALDIDAGGLTLSSGVPMEFDRLVVATGSVMGSPSVAGADQAHSTDSQADAIRFDRRLAEAVAAGPVAVAIVGAGFTGIELALELRDRVERHGGSSGAVRVLLIDRADQVGAELGDNPVR